MDGGESMESEIHGVLQSDKGFGNGPTGAEDWAKHWKPTDLISRSGATPSEALLDAVTETVQPEPERPGAEGIRTPDSVPPQITERLIRQLRLKYFTVRHPRVPECGHKLDQINEPRHRNCEICWYVWFEIHPQLVETADQFYRTQGKRALEGLRGTQFVKMFERYMATKFAQLKEQEENGTSGQVVGGSGVNTEEGQAGVLSPSSGTVDNEDGEAEICCGGHEATEHTVRHASSSEVGEAEDYPYPLDSD